MLPAYQINPNPFGDSMRYAGESVRNALMAFGMNRQREQEQESLLGGLSPHVGPEQARYLSQNPEVAKNVLAQYVNPMLPIQRQQMENSAAQHAAQLAENRRMHDQTIMQQNRMYDLQAGQIKNQSPEGRAAYAIQAGIQKGTPEFNEFVFGIKKPDPLDALLSPPQPGQGFSQPSNPNAAPMPQPQMPTQGRPANMPNVPPAALSPTPSAPGPRLMPQSFDGGQPQGDPNLIRVQAGPAQAPQAQEPMVTLPGGRQVPVSVAEAIQLQAARNKNEPLVNLMREAIGKVPKALEDDVGKMKMQSIDQIARLEGIKQRFKPEWQTWETSLKQRGLNIADSFEALRDKIPEAERKTMTQFAEFKMEAVDNLNRYIKEMTGAAMSEVEADRLRKAVPDPQKDSPTQFKSKLENSIRIAKLTHARYVAMGKFGLNKYTPIDAIPDVINQRAGQIEQQLRQQNPQAAQPLVDKAVKDALKQEFGI